LQLFIALKKIMAEYVDIKLTPNECEFHIVKRNNDTRREEVEEITRLREQVGNLKSKVTQLKLSNERPETCPVCHNQLRNTPRNDEAPPVQPLPRL
jgi:DNA repair exonuclease SbcCD ATPase subunit